jgi:hypothetical protein
MTYRLMTLSMWKSIRDMVDTAPDKATALARIDMLRPDTQNAIEALKAILADYPCANIASYGVAEDMRRAGVIPWFYLQRRCASVSHWRKDRESLKTHVAELEQLGILKPHDWFGFKGKCWFIARG